MRTAKPLSMHSLKTWLGAGLIGLVIATSPMPAGAVLGGREGGPQQSSTIMVLSSRGGVCSGVVVAQNAILTAAHCAGARTDLRIHWRDAAGEPVLIEPASVTIHPGYVAGAITERRPSVDLALIRLTQALPARFSPARLSDSQWPRVGEAVTLAGYGVLREGEARSTGTYRSAQLQAVEPYGPSKLLLWTADPDSNGQRPGRGACQGDSGGPMFDTGGQIVAITSWSTGATKGRCGLLSQGILLKPQRAWIDATLGRWQSVANWFTKP
jgi:S1-C subfamily serine protease